MADPEQIYQEVLAEQQQKGSPSVIAEARAKAARARAEHGSPHPKEPRWWPGAQPHLEGGDDGAAPAAAPEEVEEPAAPPEEVAAPAEQPAAVADTAAPAGEVTPDSRPDETAAAQPAVTTVPPAPDPATVGQPVAAATAAAPAAAATPTQLPPEARPAGVSHGTTGGTRLRPEDEVTTDAQFEGQRAMYDRRKLIDELVATGVPEVTAADTGRSRAPWLVVAYILIPLLAVSFLGLSDAGGEAPTEPEETGGGGQGVTVVAENIAFDTEQLELRAGETNPIELQNDDTQPHNIAIYQEQGGETLFQGEIIDGGESITYEVEGLEQGNYYFQCDVHPGMNGEVTVQ